MLCACLLQAVHAQDDKKALSNTSLLAPKDTLAKTGDTVAKKAAVPFHNPRIATRRSAIIPGWGQAYNREYWKIPIVYGILAIPTVAFIYNNNYYKRTRFAYDAVFAATFNKDSSKLPLIDASVKRADGSLLSLSTYQSYSNSFRRDRDYSILYFLLAWGLQVADATVFAHLKQFDVSRDLTMELTPTFNPATRSAGLGLVMNLKKPAVKAPRADW